MLARVFALTFAALFAACALGMAFVGAAPAQTEGRPNVVLILTDDQEASTLANMPKTQDLLVDRGTTLTRAYSTTALCCPSRASFLTGDFSHNHRVLGNIPPYGGWQRFRDGTGYSPPAETDTIATRLNDAGYLTGFTGKYMNGYGQPRDDGGEGLTTYVPPGWDRFNGWQGGYNQFGDLYKVNENGTLKAYDRSELHDTDYMANKAKGFIEGAAKGPDPFFLTVATNAPHSPSYAAGRHRDLFRRATMPKPPSFNEADVSDKPAWVRSLPRLRGSEVKAVEAQWRQRLRSLRSVDDLVGRVSAALARTGEAENTYVVFASDNGYSLFRHRLESKGAAYEEASRVPFVVRGPGVPAGETRNGLVGNVDFAPTVADWAGAEIPGSDGRSLSPLLSDASAPWRDALLLEVLTETTTESMTAPADSGPGRPFSALTTADRTYVEYETGERELYDLNGDPWQLTNVAGEERYAAEEAALAARLEALKGCSGDGCRAAENAPAQMPPKANAP